MGHYILTSLSDICTWNNLHRWHKCGIWGNICSRNISGRIMMNKCYSIFWLICAVMWGLYVDNSSTAVGHVQHSCHIHCRAYDHMVNCSLWIMYMLIVVMSDFIHSSNQINNLLIILVIDYMDCLQLSLSILSVTHFKESHLKINELTTIEWKYCNEIIMSDSQTMTMSTGRMYNLKELVGWKHWTVKYKNIMLVCGNLS